MHDEILESLGVWRRLWLAVAPAAALAGVACAVVCPVAIAGDDSAPTSVPLAVAVEIRPGLCPNHLRIGSPLAIPVAVLGTADLDAANIDPTTIRLSRADAAAWCEPTRWIYADVGYPVIGSSPECSDARGDGFDDLALTFPIADLVDALGLGELVGETVALTLTGKLVTGQPIEGSDCVAVIGDRWIGGGGETEIGLVACPDWETGRDRLDFGYYTNTSDQVQLTILDVRGRVVATLVDEELAPGIYHATWTRADRESRKVGPGTYFARVANSLTGVTGKFALR
ncbi:MAG: hypothetical protein WAW06_08180 [bacterium]